MGNLMSVSRAFLSLGYEVRIGEEASLLEGAAGLVLPGVGAFKDCMVNLEKKGLTGFLKDWFRAGKPFLGICLGLQLLFSESHEFGTHRGLDLLKGKVVRFADDMQNGNSPGEGGIWRTLKIPHMGWNRVNYPEESRFFRGIPQGSFFYFVHSYYVVPQEDIGTLMTEYGIDFVSGVARDNMLAVQFHPEKSQKVGLRLLSNFGEITMRDYERRA
ncbi:MAG: imidazole glycerol phosphate synthase subunit HisH [Deltaproteobacteria bacterium]|nr:imidazole glycerol phosphate synthase subunit HisH [Deltaproteobacteria bacterium]NIS78538.1 imidazole glycerol phosphate synthase subunit HisH [Deltaproteobacteria bacterium]